MYGRPYLPCSPAVSRQSEQAGDTGLPRSSRSDCAGAPHRVRIPPCSGRCSSRSGRAVVPTPTTSSVARPRPGRADVPPAHPSPSPLRESRCPTRNPFPCPPSAARRCGSPACPARASRRSPTAASRSCSARGLRVEVLDGDAVRPHLAAARGYSRDDRAINIRRIGWVAELLARNGVLVLVSAIAPFRDVRGQVRAAHEANGTAYLEVHVSTPVEVASERDVKGLYARQRVGEISRADRRRRPVRGAAGARARHRRARAPRRRVGGAAARVPDRAGARRPPGDGVVESVAGCPTSSCSARRSAAPPRCTRRWRATRSCSCPSPRSRSSSSPTGRRRRRVAGRGRADLGRARLAPRRLRGAVRRGPGRRAVWRVDGVLPLRPRRRRPDPHARCRTPG